jgi:CheY-like chemotaxis protein
VSLKVLLVDDELDQLELMKLYLDEYDPELKLDSATSPNEAIGKLKQNEYDCIVLDHSMPEMTGLELAKKIRETNRIPIILYTARGSEELASKSFDYGIDAYLRKEPDPKHFETLAKRIRRSVEKYRMEELARVSFYQNEKSIDLPEYPKVVVKGKAIYIVHEDGKEEFWGEEERRSVALQAAKEIELGLKAIKYGKNFLADSLNELMYDLMDLGIPIEYLDNIIEKGYGDIKDLLYKLANEKAFVDTQD